jgi:hypothetical protein
MYNHFRVLPETQTNEALVRVWRLFADLDAEIGWHAKYGWSD